MNPELPPRLLEKVRDGKADSAVALVQRALLAESIESDSSYELERTKMLAEYIVRSLKSAQFSSLWDPDHRPDPVGDVAGYFKRVLPRYLQTVKDLSAQTESAHAECTLSVFVPLAASDENRYIYRTLESFTRQSAAPESFEISLFGNFPHGASPQRVSATLNEVERFKADHPQIAVRLSTASLRGETTHTIGFIASLAADVALYRHHQRGLSRDHILLRCDADTRGVDRRFIENYQTLFENHPFVDSFKGRDRWSPELAVTDPLLYFDIYFYDILVQGLRVHNDRLLLGTPNYAIRASMYSYVGGYPERCVLGEGCELGDRLLRLRKHSACYTAVRDAGWCSRLFNSTRRVEAAHLQGRSCADHWAEDTKFAITDEKIRDSGEVRGGLPRSIDERSLSEALELKVARTLKGFQEWKLDVSAYSASVSTALGFFFGLDFEIIDEQNVRILNHTEFLSRWRYFREHGLAEMERRLNATRSLFERG